MHLKRLDVIGFKSFAERVGIDFVKGVTAIVGPNGCGKSNIIDAIRWVLGEQSAKSLRGAKMEDVIFAGSDSRKPLNFAEVNLTLENDDHLLPIDYQEVSITRRVFRSGESEFFINKQPCRLKDIVDLFMDSGLGREAFSIISQGRVEEILNSKAEERRTIFEEAAGVLKYKNRKKKAEVKLEETKENLNRVKDILYELESQVEPLKIQASLAKEYLQKKEELESYEVALIVYEIEQLHKKLEHKTSELEKHKETELSLHTAIQSREAKLEELRLQIEALDEAVNDLQTRLLETSEELEKMEGQKELLKERRKNAHQNKEQLEKNLQEIKEKIALRLEQKAQQEKLLSHLDKDANELKIALKEKMEQLALLSIDIDEKIESLKSDYIELLNKQASSKNELQNAQNQLQIQEKRLAKLEDDNKNYVTIRKNIQLQKQKIEKELLAIQIEKESHFQNFQKENDQLAFLRQKLEKQEKNLYEAYQLLQKINSRKDMLEELEEDFSGYYQGVKEVLKERGKKLSGIEGAIAELISVEKKYETAIETALGAAMQYIVVDTDLSARKAIQYLKLHSFGRATFYPLNVIRSKKLTTSQISLVQNHPSYIGIASDLIQFDRKYGEIIENLLGTVIIATDLKGANEMAKILQYRCRFVTIDGDVVNQGGSMTGGAVKKNSTSILSRKGELEELKVQQSQVQEATLKLEKQVKHLKNEIHAKQLQIEELRKTGETFLLKEQSLKGKIREVELEEKNLNERLEIYDLEKKQIEQEKNNLLTKKNDLIRFLDDQKEKIDQINKEIVRLTEKKQTDSNKRKTLNEEVNALKVELASKTEQLNYEKEKWSTICNELEELQKQKNEHEKNLDYYEGEIANHFSYEEKLSDDSKRKLEEKNELTQMIQNRRQERMKLTTQLNDYETELKELKRQYKGLNEMMKDVEVKRTRIDVELENLLARLREEYILTYEGAKQEYPLTIPVEEARKKVKLIKMSIDELGTVNLGAIEEYERVSERYEFLLEQKNDLQQAKDTLYEVIEEMDKEMKKRFEQTFNEVRCQFEPVFRSLFGGGRADLQLTDPNDLLHTGVEIVAQPPGKKLQNLSLLSGGERALTAIALLFSILKVRPVPFCILDEVEAALDEANVARFSEYLKKYSEETQFIVITHRKGTMEGADCLYGVTMQESGVSKIVSVRLEDTKELISS